MPVKQMLGLCATLLLSTTSLAAADDANTADDAAAKPEVDVQPYGGVLWDDSVSQAVAKLAKLGVKKLTVELSSQYMTDFAGMKDVATVDKALAALLRKPLAKKGAFESSYHPFKDQAGKEWHFWQGAKIHAEPIIIAGAVYKLEIELTTSPGVAAIDPKRVLWAPGRPTIANPMYIEDMTLTKVTGSQAQMQQVLDKLDDKYHFGWKDKQLGSGGQSAAGPQGSVRIDGLANIEYRRSSASEGSFQKAVDKLDHEQRTKGRKDEGGNL